jgi:hypothetical protein
MGDAEIAVSAGGPKKRHVGVLLFLGILFVPVLFSWFLLRSGHSNTARLLGFVWFAVTLAIAVSAQRSAPAEVHGASATSSSTAPLSGSANTLPSGTPVAGSAKEIPIPRSAADKGTYFLLRKEKVGTIVRALHKRVGVESVGYTLTETNCATMMMRELGYSEVSPDAIEKSPTKWFELVNGSSKSDLANFVCNR